MSSQASARSRPPGQPGLFVDLDGTLVDTTYLHAFAWSRALLDSGEWAPVSAIHALIGMGADQLLPALLGRYDEAIADRHDVRFAELLPEARALPGAGDLLRRCAASGITVVVVTSSGRDDVEKLLALVDAADAITAVTTNDDIERSKPAPDGLAVALERTNVDPGRTIVLGDSVWDVRAAADIGLPCIGVESGGIRRAELLAAGAVDVAADVADLLAHFDQSPIAARVLT